MAAERPKRAQSGAGQIEAGEAEQNKIQSQAQTSARARFKAEYTHAKQHYHEPEGKVETDGECYAVALHLPEARC
jgi:hypothetical protein